MKFGTCKLWQNSRLNPEHKGEEHYFREKKEGLGRVAALNGSVLEKSESLRGLMGSHWPGRCRVKRTSSFLLLG